MIIPPNRGMQKDGQDVQDKNTLGLKSYFIKINYSYFKIKNHVNPVILSNIFLSLRRILHGSPSWGDDNIKNSVVPAISKQNK